MSKNIAIVFAGGVGARMGSGLPKQFIEVNGKPIIIHTLDIFEEHPDIDEIYVACKEEYIRKLQKMVQRHMIDKVKKIVPGGATGQDSIYRQQERTIPRIQLYSSMMVYVHVFQRKSLMMTWHA